MHIRVQTRFPFNVDVCLKVGNGQPTRWIVATLRDKGACLNNRQMAVKLRQMPSHKTRSHPTETLLVHTHAVVKDGLEAGAYDNLRRALGISDQKLADSLSIPIRTLQRRLERGRFMPEESDRIARLSRIYQRAREVFESADSAREWMQTPNPSIGFAIPLELCSTDPGCVEVERLLYRIEYGVF